MSKRPGARAPRQEQAEAEKGDGRLWFGLKRDADSSWELTVVGPDGKVRDVSSDVFDPQLRKVMRAIQAHRDWS